ncbi:hypothetical protein ABZ915_43660 [Streptomyces sp. NPDC046915]|uniref:hypothetical protein n=1 Tax=Streptomyces sp. NPDC046915 TaxID=3155257 RepID=UPI0033C63D9C
MLQPGEGLPRLLQERLRHGTGRPRHAHRAIRELTTITFPCPVWLRLALFDAGRSRRSPALGKRLHTLAAFLAQTVAWHRFDLGRHTHAGQNWIAALHNAHAAGDHDIGAGLLSDLAYQAAWRGDHPTAARILNHALTHAQHPAARSLLQLPLARTLAARGDRSERRPVLRALAAAEKHLNDAGTNRPAWCAWISEADLAVDSGQALLDLGDTGPAHQLITEGEQLLPPARDKTRSVFLAYRAASHLDLGLCIRRLDVPYRPVRSLRKYKVRVTTEAIIGAVTGSLTADGAGGPPRHRRPPAMVGTRGKDGRSRQAGEHSALSRSTWCSPRS